MWKFKTEYQFLFQKPKHNVEELIQHSPLLLSELAERLNYALLFLLYSWENFEYSWIIVLISRHLLRTHWIIYSLVVFWWGISCRRKFWETKSKYASLWKPGKMECQMWDIQNKHCIFLKITVFFKNSVLKSGFGPSYFSYSLNICWSRWPFHFFFIFGD